MAKQRNVLQERDKFELKALVKRMQKSADVTHGFLVVRRIDLDALVAAALCKEHGAKICEQCKQHDAAESEKGSASWLDSWGR